jgi:hypothetical protein
MQATSTNFNTILTMYSDSGAALFQLINYGGGKYPGSKGFTRPNRIEVRSNFGGSAFATVGRKRPLRNTTSRAVSALSAQMRVSRRTGPIC